MIKIEKLSDRWPEAAVAWDWQCTRMHYCESLRFHVEKPRRGVARLYATARAPAGWLPVHSGQPKRSKWGKNIMWSARWEPTVGLWLLASLDISSYPRHSPDMRPWSMEYCEYPKDRVSDHVKLDITMNLQDVVTNAVYQAMVSVDKVPYTDEGVAFLQHAVDEAVTEVVLRRQRSAEFEASFLPSTF